MIPDYATTSSPTQGNTALARRTHQQLVVFLAPLLHHLDQHLDVRLVRTFLATIQAILTLRHRSHGLLLSELGAYLLSPAHAPAGTKRLSNLLRSPNWSAALLHQYLWHHAQERVTQLQEHGEDVLVVWDESVVEYPESVRHADLCAVRSSKAQRLKRIKPGFFNPPAGRPICVPGLHWLGLLVVGRQGPPTVAVMDWWTTRGPHATDRRTQEHRLFAQCLTTWGRRAIHIWDRGFAGGPWLQQVLTANARFVLRWQKGYKLLDRWGEERKAWQIAQGQRSWEARWLRDIRRGERQKVGVVAINVTHPHHARPLWLVVARPGKGREPWYLLTSDRIETAEAAWQVVFAYARRWQIEMAWRYGKSELAMESPRVWTWERRQRLLLMVTVAYAFLLSLLDPDLLDLRELLLRQWCHRTGNRCRTTPTPLYRLRTALSRLWLAHLTTHEPPQNSG
jgi:hypothetical protein